MCVSEKANTESTDGMKWIDLSASERLIRYSRGIQAGVEAFLIHNEGQLFDDDEDILTQMQNTMKDKKGNMPSMEACRRWFKAFTAKNAKFQTLESGRGIVIQHRIREGR